MLGLASAVRFLHLAASILALGVFAFLCLIAQPAAQRAGETARAHFNGFLKTQQRLIGFSLAMVFLTGLAGFLLQAALMTGSSLGAVFSGDALVGVFATQYGRVWLVRQGLMLSLAGLLFFFRSRWAQRELHYAGFALAAILLATLAASGHAAAGEGTLLVAQLAADAIHLVAAGVWLGALLPLALLLTWCRGGDPTWAHGIAQEATRRFSWLGIFAVSTLVATGLFNAWNLVGSLPPLVSTAYGQLLLAKLGLLLPLLAFAAMNLLHLRPRLLAAAPGRAGDLLTLLKRNILAEASLGALLLVLVAILSVTPPARHVQPVWPFAFRWDWQTNQKLPEKRSLITLGAGVAVGALAPLGYAVLRRRHRRWALGVGLAGLSSGAALALSALSVDAYPTTYRRPAVAYQAISVANGVKLYRQHCIACHGVGGYGDGLALQGAKTKRADLTAKHTGDHTAGDLFWWLSHGIPGTPMPAFESVLMEDERWDLINFLRTLSAAEQARAMAPLLEAAWLVAPDFAYQTLNGENKNLKEHRGQKTILLVLFTWPDSLSRLNQLRALQGDLALVGVEVLAVPRDARALGSGDAIRELPLVIAIDGSQEAFETYSLFRRDLSEQGMLPDPPLPSHMEFLIDRQGYIRARWIPSESGGWMNAEVLLQEATQLNREIPTAPAPDDHVH